VVFPPKSSMHFFSPHSCYMPCPSHPPSLDHSNYIWRRIQVMKLLVMQFSSKCYHFIPLWSKYSPQAPFFSNSLSLCFSLLVREQVSRPYKTTDKIIVLHIIIFMFQTADEKKKGSGLTGSKHYLNSIYS
jgi:hypothetical protein